MSEQLPNYFEDDQRVSAAPRLGKVTVLEALAQDVQDIAVNLSNASTRNSGADLDDQ